MRMKLCWLIRPAAAVADADVVADASASAVADASAVAAVAGWPILPAECTSIRRNSALRSAPSSESIFN